MENSELDTVLEERMRKVLRHWSLIYGTPLAIILFGLNLAWTELVRPSIIRAYANEAEAARDRTIATSRETKEILLQTKADLLGIESMKKQVQESLKAMKTGKLAQEVAKELAANDRFTEKFKTLSAKVNKVREDVHNSMEQLRDDMRLGFRYGVISGTSSGTQTETHKFDFPVKNSWVELPFVNCVDSIRIVNTKQSEVTVEIVYPKERRCNVIGYYKVWATSLWSVGSINSTMRSLSSPKGTQ